MDVVGDFQAGAGAGDLIALSSSLAGKLEAVPVVTTDAGSGVVIGFGSDALTPAGVDRARLTAADDFVFV